MSETPIIMYDDPKCCTTGTFSYEIGGEPRTKEFFISIDGRLFEDEHLCRWHSCTHKVDELGDIHIKHYTCGERLRARKSRELWEKQQQVEIDSDTPLFYSDEFFRDEDDLLEYCAEHDCLPSAMELEVGEPCELSELCSSYWQDQLPEDAELPSEVEEAVKALNLVIATHNSSGNPHAWEGLGKRPSDACIARLDAMAGESK